MSFRVLVTPRSSRDRVLGAHDGALKVALTAPPVEGAANQSLIKLLAKVLRVGRRDVDITQGETSRNKVVAISGVDAMTVATALSAACSG